MDFTVSSDILVSANIKRKNNKYILDNESSVAAMGCTLA